MTIIVYISGNNKNILAIIYRYIMLKRSTPATNTGFKYKLWYLQNAETKTKKLFPIPQSVTTLTASLSTQTTASSARRNMSDVRG